MDWSDWDLWHSSITRTQCIHILWTIHNIIAKVHETHANTVSGASNISFEGICHNVKLIERTIWCCIHTKLPKTGSHIVDCKFMLMLLFCKILWSRLFDCVERNHFMHLSCWRAMCSHSILEIGRARLLPWILGNRIIRSFYSRSH